ncbi:MAG: class I SAM-dependent methyltransferase [Proteobacteria bacterium]|nr:class I SAM-dependent methyltransferase [Pseudomonadota bacterium]
MSDATRTTAVALGGPAAPELPDYLVNTYAWAYLRPASLIVLDNAAVVSAILWGNYGRLKRAALAEIGPGRKVLQAACVYGGFSADLARRVGPNGRLDVLDIAPIQVENCRRKLVGIGQARARLGDAATPGGGPYEAICCFFLLHELPEHYRRAVVDGLLDCVAPGGRAVFVDYHRPHPAHPLNPLMRFVFRCFEPYAAGLIESEVAGFASRPEPFRWRKETYFGGLYQKVVAERR